jgi:hypothetical protein
LNAVAQQGAFAIAKAVGRQCGSVYIGMVAEISAVQAIAVK